jgi:2'-5' RNA ligase
MRLFVALDIDSAAVAAVESIARDVARRIEAVAPHPKITWVKSSHVHLTVRFIGEVAADRTAAIADALAPPIAVTPFEISLCGVGTFPPKGHPRVVWVGVTDGAKQVIDVEQQVSARLEQVGVAREARPFRPHLTIGRVKESGGLRSGWLADLAATPVARVRLTRVTLFESRLSAKGPEYNALAKSEFGR